MILVGDGDAEDSYGAQVQKMAREHISISVIGTNIGTDQDLKMMQQIAAWGKGRFYEANDPSVIPQILLDETQQAQQQATINETFTPSIVEPHPILAGLGPLPQLNGYVATTPKPAAQQVLISNLNDPVLAVWQYGLGRVVAWTSDALGLWTANWLRWSAAARWWANLVTWTLPAPNSQLLVNGEVFGYRWLTCRLGLLRTAKPGRMPAMYGSARFAHSVRHPAGAYQGANRWIL